MQITYLSDARRNEWNTFLAQQRYFALLQSWEWGEFKTKLGWKVYRIAVEKPGQILAGAQMLIKPLPLGLGSIAYIPRGPVGGWLDEQIPTHLLQELHRVARGHRAIFLKIEPPLLNNPVTCHLLKDHHFRQSRYANQPRATLVIDSKQHLDDICKGIPRKTRYNIRYAAQKGVTVRAGNQEDLPVFYDLMRATGRRGKFSPRTRGYYDHEWQAFAKNQQVALFMAYYQDQLLAARAAFCFGNHAADIHACSSTEYKNLRPNYLLVWEAIKWAKAHGCHTYDLWGIPDEVGQAVYEAKDPPVSNRTDGLWGVYQFKRGFSKNVVFYVGAYDYVYSPLLYTLFTNRLFRGKVADRIAVWMDSLSQLSRSVV